MHPHDGHYNKAILQVKIINMICSRFEKFSDANSTNECFIWNKPTNVWMKPLWDYFQEHQFDPYTKGHFPREVMMMWENVRTLPVETLQIIFETAEDKNFLMKFVFVFRSHDKIEPKEFRFCKNHDNKVLMFYGNWKFISFRDCVPFVIMFNKLIEQFGEETL